MSESTMKITAVFPSNELAEKTNNLLYQVNKKLNEDDTGEYVFHNALYDMGEAKGIRFDSWWFIEKIELSGKELYFEVIGSPSGTKEQDIITWVKSNGAEKVTGKAVFDGGGDVEIFDF